MTMTPTKSCGVKRKLASVRDDSGGMIDDIRGLGLTAPRFRRTLAVVR